MTTEDLLLEIREIQRILRGETDKNTYVQRCEAANLICFKVLKSNERRVIKMTPEKRLKDLEKKIKDIEKALRQHGNYAVRRQLGDLRKKK